MALTYLHPFSAGDVTLWHASVQLKDVLQSVKESLRGDTSAEIRPGPWSLDVHPDEDPVPEPFELEADYDRMMKVSRPFSPQCGSRPVDRKARRIRVSPGCSTGCKTMPDTPRCALLY